MHRKRLLCWKAYLPRSSWPTQPTTPIICARPSLPKARSPSSPTTRHGRSNIRSTSISMPSAISWSVASQNSNNSAASQPASKRQPEITLPSSLSQPSSYGCDKCPHHLARQLSQLRKRRIDRAGANIAGILDHAVEPAIDVENGCFAQWALTAVGFAWGKTQAADITQASAHGPLHRLGHRGIVHAAWIIEIGFHERQQFGAVIVRIRLAGEAAIIGIGYASALIAAGAGRKRDRQHQDRRARCRYSQVQLVFGGFALSAQGAAPSMRSDFIRAC